MIVVDEYLAIRSLLADLPSAVPDEPLGLTTSAHWRILQRIHSPGRGQLSQTLAALSPAGRDALREPVAPVLHVIDPRPLLDEGARLAGRYGGTGWLVADTIAAGLAYGRQLWFGSERSVGRRLREIADDLGVSVHVVT